MWKEFMDISNLKIKKIDLWVTTMWLWGKFEDSGQHILFSQLGVNSILGGF